MSSPARDAGASVATSAHIEGDDRHSSSGDSIAVNTAAAATWSAVDHNSVADRDRFYGAAKAFEESLYLLPADMDEKARLNMQRELFMDENANAKILDVGCGAGSWAIEMAKLFPHASVTAIVRLAELRFFFDKDCKDLVSYERSNVPQNVNFELGNVLEGLKSLEVTDAQYLQLVDEAMDQCGQPSAGTCAAADAGGTPNPDPIRDLSPSRETIPVNVSAAATWSGAEHNTNIADGDRNRFFGAAEAFEESLYMLPADADEKTRLNMQDLVSYEHVNAPENVTFELGNVLEGLKCNLVRLN
ncbi:hypothetical protein HK405_013600 [Cladochytrium tenue]|nr:hypothetical protein HK405_013600 [Cladochytrium tenue]